MSRFEDRQVLRALGWRGSKSKRERRDARQKVVRPEFLPYTEPAAESEE
ncbi:MAG TPA: hypothetical protein VNG12_18410 [Acidimicrobiales bacterium]|nr:hypothetical protein [Acidimicrobiales bacterium]